VCFGLRRLYAEPSVSWGCVSTESACIWLQKRGSGLSYGLTCAAVLLAETAMCMCFMFTVGWCVYALQAFSGCALVRLDAACLWPTCATVVLVAGAASNVYHLSLGLCV
jgi:hypothetical protein